MRWGAISIFAMLCAVGLIASLGCASDSDDEGDSTSSAVDDDTDDDTGDDDTVDDDDDNDTSDDDSGDDDTTDDDTEPAFPELDPAVCALDEPVDLQGFDPAYVRLESGSWVADKNYYLLTVLSEDGAAASIVDGDPDLGDISDDRDERIRDAAAECVGDVDCYADALLWSPTDAQAVADALADAFAPATTAFDLAQTHLRPSGMFHLHVEDGDDDLLREAWLDTTAGLQEAFNAYARSLPATDLGDIVAAVVATHSDPMPFYVPLLEVTLAAMEEVGRDEAGRYEPLEDGENAAALARIPAIDWDDYRFSIMLVPGQGPETEIPLSPLSRVRCDLAAERYKAGVIPLIVFSGGHVHPDRTPYSEAVEMKKYIMATHGIPEGAILLDPHARHTTTNLRNASREIFRYGIPPDKPVLVTTDFSQNFYIDYLIRQRCLDELGYLPWRSLERMDGNDTCMVPNPTSLYADPRDPLDP